MLCKQNNIEVSFRGARLFISGGGTRSPTLDAAFKMRYNGLFLREMRLAYLRFSFDDAISISNTITELRIESCTLTEGDTIYAFPRLSKLEFINVRPYAEAIKLATTIASTSECGIEHLDVSCSPSKVDENSVDAMCTLYVQLIESVTSVALRYLHLATIGANQTTIDAIGCAIASPEMQPETLDLQFLPITPDIDMTPLSEGVMQMPSLCSLTLVADAPYLTLDYVGILTNCSQLNMFSTDMSSLNEVGYSKQVLDAIFGHMFLKKIWTFDTINSEFSYQLAHLVSRKEWIRHLAWIFTSPVLERMPIELATLVFNVVYQLNNNN